MLDEVTPESRKMSWSDGNLDGGVEELRTPDLPKHLRKDLIRLRGWKGIRDPERASRCRYLLAAARSMPNAIGVSGDEATNFDLLAGLITRYSTDFSETDKKILNGVWAIADGMADTASDRRGAIISGVSPKLISLKEGPIVDSLVRNISRGIAATMAGTEPGPIDCSTEPVGVYLEVQCPDDSLVPGMRMPVRDALTDDELAILRGAEEYWPEFVGILATTMGHSVVRHHRGAQPSPIGNLDPDDYAYMGLKYLAAGIRAQELIAGAMHGMLDPELRGPLSFFECQRLSRLIPEDSSEEAFVHWIDLINGNSMLRHIYDKWQQFLDCECKARFPPEESRVHDDGCRVRAYIGAWSDAWLGTNQILIDLTGQIVQRVQESGRELFPGCVDKYEISDIVLTTD